MSAATLPLLLPASVLAPKSGFDPQEWKPSRYRQAPQPPPTDDSKQHDIEMAAARQLVDGKAFKKVRPRRTVDYFAGVGRWTLVSSHVPSTCCAVLQGLQLRRSLPSPRYLPYMRPALPYIIDVCNPLDSMHLYQYFTEYIVLFAHQISSSFHRKPTRGTLRHLCAPSSSTRRQTRFVVR
jgi:polyadenylation factor subunit 2